MTWGIPQSEFAPTQAAISDIGAKWVRLEFRWYEGETQNNSYSNSTLAKWDQAVATSEAAGTKIIVMVHRAPKWASGSNDTYMPPQNPADLADFMTFLANRYRGRVAAYEIWNEPNGTRFWPSGPNPAHYVDLLKPSYTAVKAADPNALVVFGGLVQNDYNFVEGAYAAGAKGYFDVMNVHPYPANHPPEQVWYDGNGRISQWAFTGYREVHASMLANGDDKPIWFTEFGWSTTTTESWGVTPEQQADYLRRAYCTLEQDPYVGVAVWYNLRNNHWDDDADTWETQLGLMKTTFERKPSYYAYKDYTPGSCPTPEPPPNPDPAPEPPPTEPEPTATAEPEPTPVEDPVESSSVRSRTSIVVRRDRLGGSRRATRQLRRVLVFGRVRGADSGRIKLRLTRVRPKADGGPASARIARAVAVRDRGHFRLKLRFRQSAKWRLRVEYVGNSEARPSRSRVLKFRT